MRESSSYSKTLNLPKSSLGNRSNPRRTSELIEITGTTLYKQQRKLLDGPDTILHDGPPYANGALHLGHAMNKILKDFINRFNVLLGKRVLYIPGWDCHGLPIENASSAKARKRGLRNLNNVERRKLARQFALEMIEEQKKGFRDFAIMTDWNSIYRTLTVDYIVRQLRVFQTLLLRGLIFRDNKPVYWSVESGTALAEAELEYGSVKSLSLFVAYPATSELRGHQVKFLIWTTTPWTLPANQAIAYNPDITYCIVQTKSGKYVVAADLVRTLDFLGKREIIDSFKGNAFAGCAYTCSLRNETYRLYPANHVTSSSGTGLVHSAPGHGKEDFVMGQEFGLPAFSPVDNKGLYTEELAKSLHELVGLDARVQGAARVCEMLKDKNMLVHSMDIEHNVPFDWRSKRPVMVRSTPQFFINLANVRQDALNALKSVRFKPEAGRQRLEAFLNARTDWCISRQRVWGVPIPALYNKETNEVLITEETSSHIIDRIEKLGDEGLELWFTEEEDISEWLPSSMAHLAQRFVKGQEIMDVWFDSGTSWTMHEPDANPVDYYLEGSDQHRGWFQSSLLTYVAVKGKPEAPYKNLITHGFTLDANQQKMSKSLGNVVSPSQLLKGDKNYTALGVDGLRLLIAQSDYTSDIMFSPETVAQAAASIKKIRLSFKYLLGNLNDYHLPENEKFNVPSRASPVDLQSLSRLSALTKEAKNAYSSQNFAQMMKLLHVHMNSHLSSWYFDISKDALYTDAVNSPQRRAIQFVLHAHLYTYVRLLSPILPLLTQEVWEHCPASVTGGLQSPGIAGWPDLPDWQNTELDAEILHLRSIRDAVNETIEQARSGRKLGQSLACNVWLQPAESDRDLIEKYSAYLSFVFIVSKVHICTPEKTKLDWSFESIARSGTKIVVGPPLDAKCPRCWQYTAQKEGKLCHKCETIVKSL